jgi:hypothetical protein
MCHCAAPKLNASTHLQGYEAFLDSLLSIFKKQSNGEALLEFQTTFRHLTGTSFTISTSEDTVKGANATETEFNSAPGTPTKTPVKTPRQKRVLGMETPNAGAGDASPATSVAASAGMHLTAQQKLEDLVEEVTKEQVASHLSKIYQSLSLSEFDTSIAEEDLSGLLFGLKRLRVLYEMVDVGGVIGIEVFGAGTSGAGSSESDDMEEDGSFAAVKKKVYESLFDLLYSTVEAALGVREISAKKLESILQKLEGEEGNFGSLTEDEKDTLAAEMGCGRRVNGILSETLKCMTTDAAKELFAAYKEALKKGKHENPFATPGSHANKAPGATQISEEDADELLETFRSRSKKVIQVAEAVVAGDPEKSGMSFDIGVRITAIRGLSDLYLMTNARAASVFPELAVVPPADVQDAIVKLFGNVVEILGLPKVLRGSLKVAANKIIKNDPTLRLWRKGTTLECKMEEMMEAASLNVLRLGADIAKMIYGGVLSVKCSSVVLKYVGIVEETLRNAWAEQELVEIAPSDSQQEADGPKVKKSRAESLFWYDGFSVFGQGWDEMGRMLCHIVFIDRIKVALHMFADADKQGKAIESVDIVRIALEDSAKVIDESLGMVRGSSF